MYWPLHHLSNYVTVVFLHTVEKIDGVSYLKNPRHDGKGGPRTEVVKGVGKWGVGLK